MDLMEICEIPEHPFFFRIAVPPGNEVPTGQAVTAVPGVVEAMKDRSKK